jgi:hypothetical protein
MINQATKHLKSGYFFRFLLLYCLFVRVFFLLFIRPILIFLWLSVLLLFLLFRFGFLSPFFFALVLSLFFDSCGFISSLPQLAWD